MANFPRATVPMDVTVETLINTVKEILATRRETELIERTHGMVVTASPDLINAVKDFLERQPAAERTLESAASVAGSPAGSCFPHPHG